MNAERMVVLVDPDAPPDLRRIASAVRAAVRGSDEPADDAEHASAIALPVGDGDTADPSLEDADVALVLDGPSLARARAAGVPRVVALAPFLGMGWGDEDLDADLVLVVHRALVEPAVEAGATASRVRVVGAVAPEGWAPHGDRDALRAELGLRVDAPWVVVHAHALDRDDLAPALVQLSLVSADVVWLFDVGVDADFARQLRRRVVGYGLDAFMFAEGPIALGAYQACDVVLGGLDGPEAIRAFAVGASLVTPRPRHDQLRLAHVIETAGLATIADAAATLSVTLDAALAVPALSRARALSLEVDAASGAARVVEAVRALGGDEGGDARLPAGLPSGFERISESDDEERPDPERRTPGPDDLDAKVDEELAALRRKLGL